jgi:hypothetical protein
MLPAPAAAGPARSVAILDVSFAGQPPGVPAQVETALRRALAAVGLAVIPPERVEIALGGQPAGSCRTDRCRIDLARRLGASRLIDAHVRPEAGGAALVLFLFNAEVGERTANVSRFCRAAGVGPVLEALPEAARALLDAEPEIPAGRLAIRTIPAGATIQLDGRPLGEGDAELPAAAGPHEVRLEKHGFAPVKLRVEVVLWQVNRVEVALAPLATAAPGPLAVVPRASEGEARSWRPWAYATLGAAVAAIAAGGVLVARSGAPTCTLAGEQRQCPGTRGGRAEGFALIGAGGAAAAGGIGLWVYDARRQRARVSVSPAGAALALSF